MTRFRPRLTYANVASSLALFVALGGTGYAALQLPRNSVGASEIRKGAVRSNEIRNRAVKLRDIGVGTRQRLRGRQGPAGPAGPSGTTFRAAVSSGGAAVLGNATSAAHQGGTNVYTVEFSGDVSACIYSAVLAAVQAGPQVEQPPPGRITVGSGGGGRVIVNTFNAEGSPSEAPFHVTASC
jgi:hypothetical protein